MMGQESSGGDRTSAARRRSGGATVNPFALRSSRQQVEWARRDQGIAWRDEKSCSMESPKSARVADFQERTDLPNAVSGSQWGISGPRRVFLQASG